jgi:hypothetical protein
MQNKIGHVSPITHANYNIRIEPAIIPFLLLGRFKMNSMRINPHFLKASEKEVTLCGKPSGGGRIIV